ncbi:LysR family transcriptional regulator [Qingshengfaniella alkalisoli]|uniref:LysR family transcriptional regulator n=1 Tax=Qingshengfaniella alkalisoli TaxID=2599296 RepID=A0A5B8J0Q3_9RHOB|nr:LysR family transcriptional regulator [Qingshengfaniella alkalisoli]QDY71474.1 LysR family transcriptional regulator [Qingshengfaniella alkalisoli]
MKLSRSLLPDATTLQAFEAAARYGSFTQAAGELSLTQSAVSRQVKELETRLGVQLFDRVRQRVVLSENGHRLLPEARRILAQIEEMTMHAMGAQDMSAVLTVATLPTFGERWLTPRLADFLTRHPGTQLRVAARVAPFDFDAERFDIAIHYGQPVWPKAVCRYLCSEAVVPVAGAAALGGPSLDADVFAQLPLLHLDTRPKLWAEWFAVHEMEVDNAYRGHRFGQFSMLIEAVASGMGIGLIPRYLIEKELGDGRLTIIQDNPMNTDLAYYSVLPEGRTDNALALAFQEWLEAQVSR